MKKIFLLLIVCIFYATIGLSDTQATGEWATNPDGSPAMVGQATNDHLFVRTTFGDGVTYDNVVSFKSSELQTVWLWLDDDQIYLNEKVQAVTPTLIANNAEPYNEITYNSVQFDIYVPQTLEVVEIENEDGDLVWYEQGNRMPNSAEFTYGETKSKVIDGITYRVYTLIISNKQLNGTHFSSKNAKMYRDNGALKKDDAPLIGIFLQNNNQSEGEGQIADMIIANQEFGFREAFTADPQWEPNEYRFIYGEGGNNETQRFQYYNRVKLYGRDGLGVIKVNDIYYSLNLDSTVSVTDRRDNTLYRGNITIPDSISYQGNSYCVKGIEETAFNGCYELTSITIPKSVTLIGSTAFHGCSGLRVLNFNATSCADFSSIASNQPFYNLNISTINIGDNVQRIPAYFANRLTGLTSVKIPESVTSIGNYAFQGCTALETLNFNAVSCSDFSSTASYHPFYNLNISTINIGDNVQRIPAYFANRLTGLTSVKIPESVTSIGNYAFQGCTALETLNFNAVSCSDFSSTASYHPFYNLNIPTIIIGNNVQRIPAYFAYGKTGLNSITIPNSVTKIGNYAFSGCTGLTYVKIPESVTSIGGGAFQGCTALETLNFNAVSCADFSSTASYHPFYNLNISTIIIGNNVQRIPAYFAYGKTGLNSITIPNSVTTIGNYAFSGCTGLTYVKIPESVTSIGNGAFQGCTALETLNFNAVSCADFSSTASYRPFYNLNISTIIIGNSVQSIPAYFAHGLTGLTSLSFGNAVTSIGNSAFYKCSGLTSVDIPNSVTTIGNSAFYNCSGLTNIHISNAITTIGDYTFSGCSGITSITIPNTVTTIGNGAFWNCSGLTSITIPGSVTSIGNSAFLGCLALDTLNYNALSCADFSSTADQRPFNNLKITTINIGNGVQKIPAYFAHGLTNLSNLTIPNSVTTIGSSAFYGCTSLSNVTISDISAWCNITFANSDANPLGYAKHLFLNGSEVTNLTIPNTVSSIKNYAFYNGLGLETVTIPITVTSIGNLAFYGCSGLSKVAITDIAAWCNISFEDNTSNPLTYAHHLYLNDSEVTDLIIPETVTSIKNYAFYNCSGLVSVTIPKLINTINNYAFKGCSALDTLYYNAVSCADFSSTASYRPFNNLNFSTIKIGDNVEKIPAYFAYGMSNLTDLSIPKSVTTIGNYAFYGCTGLTGALTIPKNVTYVGNQAFNNVPSLEIVTCAAETPPTWNDIAMFTTNVYNHTPLYVPIGSERAYMADQSWGQFATIIGKNMDNEVIATGISLNLSQMSLVQGGSSQLIATVLPDSTTNKTVTWTSSDTNVATVNNNGLVTAQANGTATITAMTTDGSNLSASCLVTVTEDLNDYENYLSIDNLEAFHGDTIVIPVKMFNEASIISFQTDIFLPEGLELLQEDGEYVIDPSERMTRTHTIMSNDISSGAIRVICYSSNYKSFTGNSGDDLFYLTVKVADDAEGDYTVQMRNTLLTTSDFEEIAAPDVAANVNVKAYLLGDANNSGTVTITDVVVTSQYVLEMNPQTFVFEAADVNFDGNITVTDVSRIAWMVLNPDEANAPMRASVIMDCSDHMSGEGITLATGETRTVSIALNNTMDYTACQLDLRLPEGLTASNFRLTDRAGSHVFDVNTLHNGDIRVLCYSPALTAIGGHEGDLLTFDVTATAPVTGDIAVDGIELVTTACQTVHPDAFTIGVNAATSINEIAGSKTVARVDYFNVAGQRIDRPDSGVILVVTTYTDGTRTTTKLIR